MCFSLNPRKYVPEMVVVRSREKGGYLESVESPQRCDRFPALVFFSTSPVRVLPRESRTKIYFRKALSTRSYSAKPLLVPSVSARISYMSISFLGCRTDYSRSVPVSTTRPPQPGSVNTGRTYNIYLVPNGRNYVRTKHKK